MKKKPHVITITVEGGLIQNIDDIPEGITVRVMDFDTEGISPTDEYPRVKAFVYQCEICAGTGKRKKVPHVGAGKYPCNACNGTGERRETYIESIYEGGDD